MCGISGIINKNNETIDIKNIKKINDLIKHRGPDDEGFYLEKNFAFGHRRLSILDLSSDGHQPMHYQNKYVITYNGEIYNYLEIKEELLAFGYEFNSHTDTEIILASYDKWGEKCVDKFNGMWAFALYDKEKNKIFCSRDRFGIKPFYYTEIDGKFVFGSEIKQLLDFYENKVVNQNILIDYLVTGMIEHNNETFFKNIYKLEQSHNLVYNLENNQYKSYRYYDIYFDKEASNLNCTDSVLKYKDQFLRSISFRLRSDVKVGTCLSGGLDSSSVAACAANIYNRNTVNKFTAIHAKSIEKSSDESYYAKRVAEHSNLDLNIIEPEVDDFKKIIDEVIYTQEEPFGGPSIFMQYFVMKKAKELNCKVMLDGQGGDETLLGYEKYYPAAYLDILKKDGLFKAIKMIRYSNKNNFKMSFKWILKYTIGGLLGRLRKFEYKRKTSFIKKKYLKEFSFIDKLSKSFLQINELQRYEIYHTNLPVLLRYEDKNSMRHSIETRLPFIDYKTLETAFSTNMEYKINDGWTKYLLRKVVDDILPEDVVWRKNKLGFAAPEKTWLESIDADMKEKIFSSNIIKTVSNLNKLSINYNKLSYRIKWRLYNIAVWENIYDVKIKT
ncbi:asparagine synthase (glutamine-hydrolyzing) [Sulfurimonas lithotrophica]|uniref:asparagine synthase (glutamine-hydrolyzing) n=1 Tax=Sulfurimonas lithotrophica TaxID=2590022 RepID=A0A5P8NZK4_9BACT|nr:asparagine synthase (glutamine-hydrolyzing) [Sulfurimonas lithotrophica]QFR48895.1 asparagine synthase (glutamine-hydrolyzing) [Sulfurimonas lithotrophica]